MKKTPVLKILSTLKDVQEEKEKSLFQDTLIN